MLRFCFKTRMPGIMALWLEGLLWHRKHLTIWETCDKCSWVY